MGNAIKKLYFQLTVANPLVSLLLVILSIGSLAYFVDRFRLDASADTLILENDLDLKYYQNGNDNDRIMSES